VGTSLHVSLSHPRTRECQDDGSICARRKGLSLRASSLEHLDIELARSLPLANTVEKVSSALASIAAADTSKHRLSRDFQSRSICDFCNSIGTYRTSRVDPAMSVLEVILLQKSKVASVRIFGETLKREAVDDSGNLSRVTEVAYEFCVRR
jgi:hypothetical protein